MGIAIALLIVLSFVNLGILTFIIYKLRVIEVTKEVQIVTTPKKEKPFVPIVIKPKTGVGNHIINELKNANK